MKTKRDGTSQRIFRLMMVWSPMLVFPTRAIPVFSCTDSDDRSNYIQTIDFEGNLTGFIDISNTELQRGRSISSEPSTIWVGQAALHSVIVGRQDFLISNSHDDLSVLFTDYLEENFEAVSKDYPIAALEASTGLADRRYELELAMLSTNHISSFSRRVAIDWLLSANLSEPVRESCLFSIRKAELSPDEPDTGMLSPLVIQTYNFSLQHSYAFPENVEILTQQHPVDIFKLFRDLSNKDRRPKVLVFMTWMEGVGILREFAATPGFEVHVFSKYGEWTSDRRNFDTDVIIHRGLNFSGDRQSEIETQIDEVISDL